MSGGYFEYDQYKIDGMVDSIADVIIHNDDESLDDFGQKRGTFFSPETMRKFHDAIEVLKRAKIYAQRIDYLLSDDDGEESFHSRLDEELKELDGIE